MLPKPGKKKSDPNNYRPITLSSCIGKLFEKSLKSRIENMIKRLKSENESQAAYKKKRSCQEHTLYLAHSVTQALNKRECVLAVMLDVRGAFDKLWSQGLIYKLHKWGLPTRLLRCVASFMSHRSLKVHEGAEKSREIRMLAGTPQGSIISPILFILFMDDVKEDLPEGVRIFQFTDDIALSVTSPCPRAAEYKMQKGLEVIEKWTRKWRVELEPTKSNFIIFSQKTENKLETTWRRHRGKERPEISWNKIQ